MSAVPSSREILSVLKLHGIHTLTADAIASIQRQIAREDDPRSALATLAGDLRKYIASKKDGASGAVIDQNVIRDVVAESTRNEEDTQQVRSRTLNREALERSQRISGASIVGRCQLRQCTILGFVL